MRPRGIARLGSIAAPAGAAVLLAWLAVAGCGKKDVVPVKEAEKCELQLLTFSVIASPQINPTDAGETRPVQVRLYQLKNDVRFLNASFENIWKKDKEELADDLIKVDEFPAYPDTRTEVKFQRDEAAQYVVAAALFRTPRGKSWFTSFELPPPPGKGACGVKGEDGGAPPQDPHFYVWIDQTKVEDGIEHADEFPEGRVHALELPAGSGASPAPSGGPAAPGAADKPPAAGAASPPSTGQPPAEVTP